MIRRRLFTLASAVSLLLCVATVGLWVRTYAACDRYQHIDHSGSEQPWHISLLYIQTFRGEIAVGRVQMGSIPRPTQPLYHIQYHDEAMRLEIEWREHPDYWRSTPPEVLPPLPGWRNWRGFGFYRPDPTSGIAGIAFMAPCWSLVVTLLILPVVWIARKIRLRRNLEACPVCDYNLTGNTSGVCPEYGTAVAGRAAA